VGLLSETDKVLVRCPRSGTSTRRRMKLFSWTDSWRDARRCTGRQEPELPPSELKHQVGVVLERQLLVERVARRRLQRVARHRRAEGVRGRLPAQAHGVRRRNHHRGGCGCRGGSRRRLRAGGVRALTPAGRVHRLVWGRVRGVECEQ
jgi:hypothetical protein